MNNLVKFWEDKKDIKIAIHETLADLSFRKELIGWVRGDTVVNTAILAEEIARLTKENSELRYRNNLESKGIALYANLTYNELEELLKKEPLEIDKNIQTLFDYISIAGQSLTTGVAHISLNEETKNK